MFFTLYASLSALLICWLALNVVKSRKKNSIGYGDGGVDELIVARSAHSNAIETILIALILLYGLEINGGELWMIHLFGASLLIGRVLHAKGMLSKRLSFRKLGMKITAFTIVALAILNVAYMPYAELMAF